MPDILATFIILGLSFLLSRVIGPQQEGGHRDILDAEIALNQWRNEHRGIHPADYPQGRLLAENYRNAILARLHAHPETREDSEYLTGLARAEKFLAPKQSGSFHAIA